MDDPRFQEALALRMRQGLPLMTERETQAFTALLPASGPACLFEYGSGYSTLYTARTLVRLGLDFRFHSVENNPLWFDKVGELLRQEGLEDRVTRHLCPFPAFWEKPGWDWAREPAPGAFAPRAAEELEYVAKPLELGLRYAFILVDGRFRRRCLELLPGCLAPGGVVFLHDAQKPRYHPSLPGFAQARMYRSGPYYPGEPERYAFWVGGNPDGRRLGPEWRAAEISLAQAAALP